MAKYPSSNFNSYSDEDPEEFIDFFYLYLIAIEINILARHTYRVQAYGLFETLVQLGVNLRHDAVGQAGNIVISAHIVFDEDWSFANRHSTDQLSNMPNANARQTIVADRI
ncbi:21647_t:CDS:2 [Cetraspora pellucida]|uniref:21647_t:CDS:1 n=1 Tax=Cetraspora pellucida TaxID=1433469 RepID=A0A9N9CZ34_9GLOM|nr:21647_t:CDS:2 [Cetraspora pellucida]